MTLLQKLLDIQRSPAQRRGVFGHPLRIERPDRFRQLSAVGSRRRDRQRRVCGIDVDRRHIELKSRMYLTKVYPEDPGSRLQIADQREVRVEPIGPLAFFQDEALALKIESHNRLAWVAIDHQCHARCRLVFLETVDGPFDLQLGVVAEHGEANNLAAGYGASFALRIIRVERERPLGAMHVGRSHPRQRAHSFAFRRKVRRHADDACRYAGVGQERPKRLSAAVLHDLG